MADVEISAVQSLLSNLKELLHSFTTELKDNLTTQTIDETLEEIVKRGEIQKNEAVSELEQAKLLNLNAYVLVSLYFTHLKLKGDKVEANSSIISEIKRVKEFMDKVKVAETQLHQKEKSELKEAEASKELIRKHYGGNQDRTPAVSNAHFESNEEKPEAGTHLRFEDKDDQKQMAKSLKANVSQKRNSNSANKVKKASSKKQRKGKK